jgi:hypothetical protein
MVDGEPTSRRALDPSSLAISGDPLGSRILALLLRDSGYRAKCLPASSLDEPGALRDVQLVVLTPTRELSVEHREALVASLKETSKDTSLIVIELTTLSEGRHIEEPREWPLHRVPWPCRFEELEQRIEAALRLIARR